jgi:hypothetical protein
LFIFTIIYFKRITKEKKAWINSSPFFRVERYLI